MRKVILKIIWIVLGVMLVYIILGAILPLLTHKQADATLQQDFQPSACYEEEISKERVLCIDDNLDALLWRIRIIETAQEEIILSTFDFCQIPFENISKNAPYLKIQERYQTVRGRDIFSSVPLSFLWQ